MRAQITSTSSTAAQSSGGSSAMFERPASDAPDEALRRSEARLAAAVSVAGLGLFEHDHLTESIFWSARMKEIMGRPDAAEVRLEDYLKAVHPEDLPSVLEQVKRAHQPGGDGFYSIEHRIVHPSGQVRWIGVRSRTFFEMIDGTIRPVRTTGATSDITERKTAEMATAQDRSLLRTLIDNIPGHIYIKDCAGRYVVNNLHDTRFLGAASEAEVVGKTVFDFFPPEIAAQFFRDDMQVIAGEPVIGREEPYILGARRGWFSTIKVPLRDRRGQITGLIGITLDITERKEAEAERAHLEAQLRQAQKMEALGTLAGGIAHDFNNILGAILGNAELALQDVPFGPAGDCLQQIVISGNRAKALVQQILAFSRKQGPETRCLALPPVVHEVMRMLRSMLPASVELAADIRDDTPPVLADPTSIHQILLNLCTNSWHALEGRPGRISIALGLAEVHEAQCRAIANLHPGRYARLAVTDNGAGMAASTMERAFDPFFTTKPVGKGTGLGLSVVHGLVQNHGGAVAVSSELGQGATFEVFLPEHVGESPTVPDRSPNAQPSPGAGETILYVDDEPSLVSLARRMLERSGYRVCGFSDPKAALARLEANPNAFDLIVTDYNMPGFSGLQLAGAASRLSPKLPIILISGYITKELEVQAAAAGVRAFISKPNIASELRDTVRRFLAASRQESGQSFAAGI